MHFYFIQNVDSFLLIPMEVEQYIVIKVTQNTSIILKYQHGQAHYIRTVVIVQNKQLLLFSTASDLLMDQQNLCSLFIC